jgi:hypothetical protein
LAGSELADAYAPASRYLGEVLERITQVDSTYVDLSLAECRPGQYELHLLRCTPERRC